MFIVTIENNGVKTEIHGEYEKLSSGKVVKGINAIDSFSFTVLPSNPGFDLLNDFTTLVKVYNTNRDRYEFYGRVLYSDTTMNENGLITKQVTCESYFGFLCDSQQSIVGTKNWTVLGLLQHIIDKHNSQVEEYKRFAIGEVTVTDPNDNLYLGIQYANTWDTIKQKLLDKLGGEIRFRVVGDVIYLDYLTELGKVSETEIAVSHNMKFIKQERDPSSYITRLIPLGMKMGENDERLEITKVNGGKNYIDDEEAIAQYGIHVGYVEWDDVTEESNLLRKGQEWLRDNNKLLVKYSITALDLSLLGLDFDDFDVCNYHPLKNHLINVDDVARIVKQNIDICDEVHSTIEIGDNIQAFSDIQISQAQETARIYSKITKTDEELRLEVKNELERVETLISQTARDLTLSATCENGTAKIVLSATNESGTSIEMSSDTFDVNVDAMNISGKLRASQIETDELRVDAAHISGKLVASQINADGLEIRAANISGSISFGNLDESMQKSVQWGVDAYTGLDIVKDELYDLADGRFRGTFIDENRIISPEIKAGHFYATGEGRNNEAAYYIYNGYDQNTDKLGNLVGFLSFDSAGAGNFAEAKNRVMLTSSSGVALKLNAGGNMSLEANDTIYVMSNMMFGSNILLGGNCYGPTLPASGVEGQLFFKTEATGAGT